jgi:hypothetical protein
MDGRAPHRSADPTGQGDQPSGHQAAGHRADRDRTGHWPAGPGRGRVGSQLGQLVIVDRSELYKGKPVKALTEGKRKTGGRNNKGHVTSRGIAGGHKQKYRYVDFKRRKWDMPAVVERLDEVREQEDEGAGRHCTAHIDQVLQRVAEVVDRGLDEVLLLEHGRVEPDAGQARLQRLDDVLDLMGQLDRVGARPPM